jgi:hypothetical protein
MHPIKRAFQKAKDEGRLCPQCEWIITKKDWEKGYRICRNCTDINKGVNTPPRFGPYRDEPVDRTGNM